MKLKKIQDCFKAINLKVLKNLQVRELEQESPNNYIAFVDDGDLSYDVSVALNEADYIISTM